LLFTADVVPISPIAVALKMEAIRSWETSVLTRVTRRNIPEDGILHSYRRENPQTFQTAPLKHLSIVQYKTGELKVFCILTFQGFALTNFTDHLSQ
jgi:hypothetical protein